MPKNRRHFRNPVARSPLLRKGGPHQRCRSGERRQSRHAVEAELDEWLYESDIERHEDEAPPEGGGSSEYPWFHSVLAA